MDLLIFPPFASLRIFFIFRKKIDIRKCGLFPPPQEKQGKKSCKWEFIICSLQNHRFHFGRFTVVLRRNTVCWLLKMFNMNIWTWTKWTLLPYYASFLCSSVSPFVKQPSCATVLYLPEKAGTPRQCSFFHSHWQKSLLAVSKDPADV